MKWWHWVLIGVVALWICRTVVRNGKLIKGSDVDAMPNNTAA